jgi:hypothetical protein
MMPTHSVSMVKRAGAPAPLELEDQRSLLAAGSWNNRLIILGIVLAVAAAFCLAGRARSATSSMAQRSITHAAG